MPHWLYEVGNTSSSKITNVKQLRRIPVFKYQRWLCKLEDHLLQNTVPKILKKNAGKKWGLRYMRRGKH